MFCIPLISEKSLILFFGRLVCVVRLMLLITCLCFWIYMLYLTITPSLFQFIPSKEHLRCNYLFKRGNKKSFFITLINVDVFEEGERRFCS